jgi:hypothetical protein
VLCLWHKHVTTQSGLPLKSLVTDNSELVSNFMKDWCASLGINHVVTAPYTSAQNGHAEHVHRTILGKACTMRLACNAPPSFWDEFCATATYLTNFTATPTLNHKTAYEMWFGRWPSLSHLHEIGCRAFTLIQTNNPKIFQRSNPCILVGYAPNSKVYRLWDVSTGKCFNSFHVTFIEHLNALPSSLLPGTTVELLPGSLPSWDSPSIDLPPAACTSIPVAPSLPPISPASPLSASIPSPHAPLSLPSTLPPPNVVFPDSHTTIQITPHPSNTVGQNNQNNLPVVTLDTTNTDHQITNTDRQLIVHPLDTVADPLLAPSTLLPAMLTPSADDPPPPDPSPPTDPPLRRSTRLRFPYSRMVTLDGLLPNPRAAAAISDNLPTSHRDATDLA